MSSSISILNNTPDDWVCKMGYDEVALKVGILIASIVGVIAGVLATGGMASPLMTVITKAGTTALLGVSSAAFGPVGTAVISAAGGITVVGTVSTFSHTVATKIIDTLVSHNFHHIKPNETFSWKRTLSLWQQGTCVQTSIIDEHTTKTRTVYMRPIFSGSTIGSNRVHDIKWWIEKKGTKDHLEVGKATTGPTTRKLANTTSNSTEDDEKEENPPFLVPVSDAEDAEPMIRELSDSSDEREENPPFLVSASEGDDTD